MKIGSSLKRRIGSLVSGTAAYKTRLLEELLHVPDLLIIVTNAKFELQMANDYFYDYFDCQPEWLAGKPLYSFLSDDIHGDMNETHINRILSEGHVWDYDAHTARADGETVLIRWNQTAFHDANEQSYILSVGLVQTLLVPEHNLLGSSAKNAANSEYAAGLRFFPPLTVNDLTLPNDSAVAVTEEDIRHALANQGILLHYQPIVSGRSKKIVGAESLVRMLHPQYGLLEPSRFMPAAEQSGLIIPIGEYVIETVCKKINRWDRAGLDLFLSINISTQQFIHPFLAEILLHGITKHDVAAGRLLLEITEDTASRDWTKVQSVLQVLRGMGCRISLDDFGTRLTTYHYLEHLDIDNLKIDKAFLSNTLVNRKSYAIIESIIVLAHGLGISVTAEGVETQAQLSFLLDKACDYVQGYLLSHPLPETEYDRLVNENPRFSRNM